MTSHPFTGSIRRRKPHGENPKPSTAKQQSCALCSPSGRNSRRRQFKWLLYVPMYFSSREHNIHSLCRVTGGSRSLRRLALIGTSARAAPFFMLFLKKKCIYSLRWLSGPLIVSESCSGERERERKGGKTTKNDIGAAARGEREPSKASSQMKRSQRSPFLTLINFPLLSTWTAERRCGRWAGSGCRVKSIGECQSHGGEKKTTQTGLEGCKRNPIPSHRLFCCAEGRKVPQPVPVVSGKGGLTPLDR